MRSDLSIAQLEDILSHRKQLLAKLTKARRKAEKNLDSIDREIAGIGGSVNGRSGRKVQNEHSLTEMIRSVLEKSKKPMNVGDIADQVKAAGYHSNSDSFRAIVNQTLIKESKQFQNAGERGMYQLKAAKPKKAAKKEEKVEEVTA